MSSGMKLTEALFQEPSFALRQLGCRQTADKDSQWLKDVTEAYNSDEFKAYSQNALPVTNILLHGVKTQLQALKPKLLLLLLQPNK